VSIDGGQPGHAVVEGDPVPFASAAGPLALVPVARWSAVPGRPGWARVEPVAVVVLRPSGPERVPCGDDADDGPTHDPADSVATDDERRAIVALAFGAASADAGQIRLDLVRVEREQSRLDSGAATRRGLGCVVVEPKTGQVRWERAGRA
jgi:hypothetical protein